MCGVWIDRKVKRCERERSGGRYAIASSGRWKKKAIEVKQGRGKLHGDRP